MNYDPKQIESKWQQKWANTNLYKTPEQATAESKMYILPQLPYPSGSGLHVGHAEVYTACDIYARYQRMMGKDVLQVIGWDSFGLPAENYAIKTNVHPRVSTDNAIENFREQIRMLGISVDWEREVGAHNPDYYKWTQWFFLLFYKRGLAYRKMQAVNWCECCKTVLANDQVKDTHCERCDTVVIQKEMEQWYIKITDYAEKLIEGLDRIDWPEETKKRQRDWIGRSEGAELDFVVKGHDAKIRVFTTRPDTLFGATYMVLAPEHSLVQELKSKIKNWEEVAAYIAATAKKTDLDRQIDQEKTGVALQGIHAINPVNGEAIPVWIADFVLASYGTGAIFADAHDERDFEFAKKYNILLRATVRPKDEILWEQVEKLEVCFTGDGILVHSDFLDGLSTVEAKEKIITWLEEKGIGRRKIQYKLRDWSVSRQRFWGAPIPVLSNETEKNKKRTFVFIHGFQGSPDSNYFPTLKATLEAIGHTVVAPRLPHPNTPNLDEQVDAILREVVLDADTVLLGHSLGTPVLFKLLAKAQIQVAKVVLSDGFYKPEFNDTKRPEVEASTDWSSVDPASVKQYAREWVVVADRDHPVIPKEQVETMAKMLEARLVLAKANKPHFGGEVEEVFNDEVPVSGLCPLAVTDLPVMLPDDVDFQPTGQSPLTYSESFQEGVEEKYGIGWKREMDTLDTFMCSSWYYYRYLDPKNDTAFASSEALKKWMPVDFYLGGEEHVNGHLLYSRFFTKVLYDAGYIDFDEPFLVHRHQGLILGEDSRKMSKRWGNVINPTDVVNQYGADTCRIYEMFMGPLEATKPWSDGGVKGVRRFLDKIWKLQEKVDEIEPSAEITALLHKTIKKVSEDTVTLGFNTAIAKMMEFVNALSKEEKIAKSSLETFLKLLSPYAPHMAEEIWEALGNTDSITTQSWPTYDESLLVEDMITLAVQVNGKLRATISVPTDVAEEDAKAAALKQKNVQKWLDGEPKKVIYVKGKLVSIVV